MSFLELPEGRLAVALGIGLVIGAERERRKGAGPDRKGAGIRTFAAAALLGGVAAMLRNEILLVSAAMFVGGIAMVAYWLGDREDPGYTSEITIVLTYCLGALAQQEPHVALAAGISIAMLLALRAPLHRFTRNLLRDEELRDGLLLAVAAVVVLPLLPDRTIDPWGVLNPFTLWRLVVVLMAMSAAGYVAQRAIGPRYGLALAGLGGGFVSSSATIAAMGTRVRADPALLQPAVAGAAASTVATFVQLAILVGTANPALVRVLAWPLAAGGATAALFAAAQTWHARRATGEAGTGSAFKLSTALLFGCLVTVIGFASTLATSWLGTTGAIVAAAIAGFVDAHASTAAVGSMAASGAIDSTAAALAVLVALSTNTVTKAVLSISTGTRRFAGLVCAGLVLTLGVTWAVAFIGL